MYATASIVERTNIEFLKSAARGVTLLGATGDGGSHFSFGAFPSDTQIGLDLNDISCRFALPTFPAESPYVLGVGGEQWDGGGTSADPVNSLAAEVVVVVVAKRDTCRVVTQLKQLLAAHADRLIGE